MSSPWLTTCKKPSARQHLYMFPYAGGNPSAYLSFSEGLGPETQLSIISLPGRGMRQSEAQPNDLRALAQDVAAAISTDITHGAGPVEFVVFGHSMGAVLALEVLRVCTLMHLPLPRLMIASGCRWPGMIDYSDPIYDLPEPDFYQRLKDLGGTPEDVLEHEELMQVVSPRLRADFEMLHHYRYRPSVPLPLPLHVFAGRQDKEISSAHLFPWFEESRSPGLIHWFDGGHFFLHEDTAGFLQKLREVLS